MKNSKFLQKFFAGRVPLLLTLMFLQRDARRFALSFVLGMFVMRAEMTRSDARYGVEVSRGDPWASFFDLQWEEDSPRVMNAGSEHDSEPRPRRRVFRRKQADQESAE